MNTIEKRDYIHSYLNRLDDKDIDDVFNKVKALIEEEVTLTQSQEEEIERRVDRHKKGESESHPWSEVKKRIHP